MSDITNSAKFITVANVTERVDALRAERALFDAECLKVDPSFKTERDEGGALTGASLDDDGQPRKGTWESENTDDAEELATLEKLLEALDSSGAREYEWNGGHYPQTLIAEHHFADYAREIAEDCGDISRNASYIVVDWEKTADGLKQDYKQVDYDGETYWHRA